MITADETLRIGMQVRVTDLDRDAMVLDIDRGLHVALVRFANGQETWWWSEAMTPLHTQEHNGRRE